MLEGAALRDAFRRNLVRLLFEKDATQRDLAEYLGVTPTSVNDWCRGKKLPRMDKIDSICAFLQCKRSELLGIPVAVSVPTQRIITRPNTRVPVLGTIAAGIPISAITDIIDYEEIDEKLASTGEFFGLRVRGESMAPVISPGDTVICRAQDYVQDGQIAVVIIEDEATLKMVRETPEGIMLIAYNPAVFPPVHYTRQQIETVPIVIRGLVVECRHRFI